MDVNKLIEKFEQKSGTTVFPDFCDDFVEEAKEEYVLEVRMKNAYERKNQGIKK